MKKLSFNKTSEDNPQDPVLHVFGYGMLRLSQIKWKVKEYTRELNERAQKEDWRNAAYFAYSNGVLKVLIETILEYEEKMEKQKGKPSLT